MVRDEVHVQYPGQNIELACDFYMEFFDLFQNPIVWKKAQLHEITSINTLGNVMPPFVDTARFSLNFVDSEPKYKVVLTITGNTIGSAYVWCVYMRSRRCICRYVLFLLIILHRGISRQVEKAPLPYNQEHTLFKAFQENSCEFPVENRITNKRSV